VVRLNLPPVRAVSAAGANRRSPSTIPYHVSGALMIRMDDGTGLECRPGDVPSGHDAWVVGDEPVVVIDCQGKVDYAKRL